MNLWNPYPLAAATLAVTTDDLKPVDGPGLSFWPQATLAAALVVAVVCVVAVVLLSRPSRRPAAPPLSGSHRDGGDAAAWRARVDEVVRSYENGELDREQAFDALAALARDFASASSGLPLHASTLTDIAATPRTGTDKSGLDALRMTIAALYPPQFADPLINPHARDTQVQEAAGWVLTLIERWGR